MKRNHQVEIGGKKLTLSLTFGTSLDILEEIGSPTDLVQTIVTSMQGRKTPENGMVLNERMLVRILEIGNEPHEGLDFDELGELAIDEGFTPTQGIVFGYLSTMVLGRKAMEEVETAETAEGTDEGN